MAGPLSGIRVLDLTRVMAGPWCTQILADFGAQVIKIEHPTKGDDTRKWGPPWLKNATGEDTENAAYYFAANRNKHSVCIDIKTDKGIEIVKKLAKESDIFIENFKVGGLAKMNLDYPALAKIKQDIIYLSISGFGQTGPMANQPGYDYLIQGFGGLMSITGEKDGQPGSGPQRVGVPIVDINAGLYATIGLLSALHHRNNTGEGQYIDLGLLDSQVGWLCNQAMNYLIGGEIPKRTGNDHPNLVPYQPFTTQDGEIIIAVGNDHQFTKLCQLINLPELATDPRFVTNRVRIQHRELIGSLIQTQIAKRKNAYWLEALPEVGVPCSVINNIANLFDSEQAKARQMRVDLPDNRGGTVPGVANPLKFSKTQVEYNHAAPLHGEHTESILSSLLNYQQTDIDQLKEQGVI